LGTCFPAAAARSATFGITTGKGGRRQILTAEELSRLAAVMTVRPSIFEIWAFGTGRKSAAEAARAVAGVRERAGAVAARAREAFRDAA